MFLHNRVDKRELKKKLQQENVKRITLSFYRYVIIENPQELRDKLFAEWTSISILGRIYIAREGINAQRRHPRTQVQNRRAFNFEWVHIISFRGSGVRWIRSARKERACVR